MRVRAQCSMGYIDAHALHPWVDLAGSEARSRMRDSRPHGRMQMALQNVLVAPVPDLMWAM
eukprot:9469245-Alexandrium_andersonii.AAC.1